MNQLLCFTCFILTLPSTFAKNDLDPYYCSVTNGNCKVPHQSSMLVLDCPGGKGVVIWQHEIYDLAAHHYHNVTICPAYQNRTCNVRGYKGHLSNGDSGPYYCIETETSARRVNVTILAPPKITNVFNNDPDICSKQRDQCKTSPYSYQKKYFNVTIDYTSIGPIEKVQWFLNGTELDCPSTPDEPISHNCLGVYSTSTYTTIRLGPNGKYSLNGMYSAFITNEYGTNSSLTEVRQDCTETTQDVTHNHVYFNVTAGEPLPVELTRACRNGAALDLPRYLCFTNNSNVTFDESIKNFNDCAICAIDTTGRCSQFKNNNHFSVSASAETCPKIVNLSIKSRENSTVDFSDSGRIFCSYLGNDGGPYTTVHIRVVSKPPPNLLSVIIAVPAGTMVLLVVVTLLVVITVLGYKYRTVRHARSARVRQRRRVEAERALLIQEEGTASINATVSSNRRPPQRTYRTFPTKSSDSDPGIITDVQPDHPEELPVQSHGNSKEINI